MLILPLLFLAIFVAGPARADATRDALLEIAKCADIADSSERLKCFDAAVPGAKSALAAPVRSLTPGMGFSVLIESFIVTVIGGMGSIVGAFVAALAIGLIRAFGSLGFPLFTDGLMYLFMVLILIARPTGLFGKEIA